MDVFKLRNDLVDDFADYTRSFVRIRDEGLKDKLEDAIQRGWFWPAPLIQLNPFFERGGSVEELVERGVLHPDAGRIFRVGKGEGDPLGKAMTLHRHQVEAIEAARQGENYVLTTGTGSGKSLTYIVPIVDHVLREGSGRGIQAIVVYPMNALANSQLGELEKFLGNSGQKVTFQRFTGQESQDDKAAIRKDPPDILLTNYVMLELLLTRPMDRNMLLSAKGLRFLVFDELHTYRGRQGSDVSMLIRRLRESLGDEHLQCVGTSATMASGQSTYAERQEQVADVASKIFGCTVKPQHVIGETLVRLTEAYETSDAAFMDSLARRLNQGSIPHTFQEFQKDPLARWIESQLGLLREEESGRLVRARPRSIEPMGHDDGLARHLSDDTGVEEEICHDHIKQLLLHSYDPQLLHPVTGRAPFAFRLHQFLSPGSSLHATLEPPERRYATVRGQKFAPGKGEKRLLYPLVFCRECGKEFFSVFREGGSYSARQIREKSGDDDIQAGYIYIDEDKPWPEGEAEQLGRAPRDWLEERRGMEVVKRDRRKYMPVSIRVTPIGNELESGQVAAFLPAPFLFCPSCGVTYDARSRSDFAKLSTLQADGRSTATTLVALSSILELRDDPSLDTKARKLLSFTDNRQDAALQAGHFNDFIQISMVRGALYHALLKAGDAGLRYDTLPEEIFRSLDLPFDEYALNPEEILAARTETERALKGVLEYRVYQDLGQGWRLSSPNLELTGLLQTDYLNIAELCHTQDFWRGLHESLVAADPKQREEICLTLLDHLRRSLAVKVDVLEEQYFEQLQRRSSQKLMDPWSLDDREERQSNTFAVLRSRKPKEGMQVMPLTRMSAFARYLRRPNGPLGSTPITGEESERVIEDLISILCKAGLLIEAMHIGDTPAYQVPASAIVWRAGDGTEAFQDRLKMPTAPEAGRRANPYFVDHYQRDTSRLHDIEGREHTAQVHHEERQEREALFRKGELQVLFCSPTMELGVDIAELNVVHMRNVPPTPANYAQRSGRAGRSGQPALVLAYCSAGSPHDQFYFKRPGLMVQGQVSPPRIDLANEDLVRAHMHAVWLAETGADLKWGMGELLELGGEPPKLHLLSDLETDLRSSSAVEKADRRCRRILDSIKGHLHGVAWFTEDWIADTMRGAYQQFEESLGRWRTLYRSAWQLAELQHRIQMDASRPQGEKRRAQRLRREALAQIELLSSSGGMYTDFYTYRYFASEGFLPGYNFPRLPLSAFIPSTGRKRKKHDRDEFISRSRFLAISEFAPRAFLYHEGNRFQIDRVLMEFDESDSEIPTSSAKICSECGYNHPVTEQSQADLCEHCGFELPTSKHNLFRLRNVGTRRVDRITSSDEERQREGYEILTCIRFAETGAGASVRKASATQGERVLMDLWYGEAATLRRINLGLRRRGDKWKEGWNLDIERGYWKRDKEEMKPDEKPEEFAARCMRVIPFVEDRKNSLLVHVTTKSDPRFLASLRAALKSAIQVEFQVEEMELAAEPIPERADPKRLLFYEASEGGAGVLRRLIDDQGTLNRVARRALELCHFDPDTGVDKNRAEGAPEDCVAACYDCLLSYGNQPDHDVLDRALIKDFLLELSRSEVAASSTHRSRSEQLEELRKHCDSELERSWLDLLVEHDLRLPSDSQKPISEEFTVPDFLYESERAAIYIDGPPHDHANRQQKDVEITTRLEDLGWMVLRFHHSQDWLPILQRYPSLFGVISTGARDYQDTSTGPDDSSADTSGKESPFDQDLFEEDWLPLLRSLADQGFGIEPGTDVAVEDKVLGTTVAEIQHAQSQLTLLDARHPSAQELTDALKARGISLLTVTPTEGTAFAQIVQALQA